MNKIKERNGAVPGMVRRELNKACGDVAFTLLFLILLEVLPGAVDGSFLSNDLVNSHTLTPLLAIAAMVAAMRMVDRIAVASGAARRWSRIVCSLMPLFLLWYVWFPQAPSWLRALLLVGVCVGVALSLIFVSFLARQWWTGKWSMDDPDRRAYDMEWRAVWPTLKVRLVTDPLSVNRMDAAWLRDRLELLDDGERGEALRLWDCLDRGMMTVGQSKRLCELMERSGR